jgi:hypothetical protein
MRVSTWSSRPRQQIGVHHDGGERTAAQLRRTQLTVSRTFDLKFGAVLVSRIDPSVEPLAEQVGIVVAQSPEGVDRSNTPTGPEEEASRDCGAVATQKSAPTHETPLVRVE